MGEAARYLRDYMALPEREILVTATWIGAAWLKDCWDRFPHVVINSPEKRSGKTLLLQLLHSLVPNPRYTANMSPAVLYRMIAGEGCTILFDEAQSMGRRGSESDEKLLELFNAGITKDAKVFRCGGANNDEVHEFAIYSPKIMALIGEVNGVLADRSLSIRLKRKTSSDIVQRYRSRIAEPRGAAIKEAFSVWAEENAEQAKVLYDDHVDPFPIDNDRMAELLVPLQVVLSLSNKNKELLPELEAYAYDLEQAEAEDQEQSPGVLLLRACRDIFAGQDGFVATASLLKALHARSEERWATWHRDREPLRPEALATLLRPYGIKPVHRSIKVAGQVKGSRGYWTNDFAEVFARYL